MQKHHKGIVRYIREAVGALRLARWERAMDRKRMVRLVAGRTVKRA